MAGEVYIGKLVNGHLVIGESNDADGLKNAFMIALIPDPENQKRIAINMKSMFWPLSDDGADVDEKHLLSITEISTADLIQEYVRTKTGGKLDIVTGNEANQVMSQLNKQISEARQQGIIKE